LGDQIASEPSDLEAIRRALRGVAGACSDVPKAARMAQSAFFDTILVAREAPDPGQPIVNQPS
jgi:hypothetical protein